MEVVLAIGIAVVAAALVVAAMGASRQRLARDVARADIWAQFEAVAEAVPGLAMSQTEDGHPRLVGLVDGCAVEIDFENYIAFGLEAMLGMRCDLAEAALAPNAALWVGEVMALHSQFGRPRPLGDSDGLFDLYTRAEPSASDWWQEPELHDALASLVGSGVTLMEGQLTVIFSELDAESVRMALRVPALIRRGVSRVTLH